VVVMLLAGCGSGSTRAPQAGLTRAQYIATVDPICRAGKSALKPLTGKLRTVSDENLGAQAEAEKVLPILRNVVHIYRTYAGRMQEVRQPAGDSEVLGKIAAGNKDQGAALDHAINALANHELAALHSALKEREEADTRVAALERGYGFKVCGQEE
jgi:hypothetical protein